MVPWIGFLPVTPGNLSARTLGVENQPCQSIDIDSKILPDPGYG
jgi:hypothetical protein